MTEIDGIFSNFDEEHLYFIMEDSTEYVATDWKFLESEVLFRGQYIRQYALGFDDGIIYSQLPYGEPIFDGTYYYYDLESTQIKSFSRPSDELPHQIVFDKWIFFSANLDEGQADFVMMEQDDFVAGETDYIYLK